MSDTSAGAVRWAWPLYPLISKQAMSCHDAVSLRPFAVGLNLRIPDDVRLEPTARVHPGRPFGVMVRWPNENQERFGVGCRYYLPAVEDLELAQQLFTGDPGDPPWHRLQTILTTTGHPVSELRSLTCDQLIRRLSSTWLGPVGGPAGPPSVADVNAGVQTAVELGYAVFDQVSLGAGAWLPLTGLSFRVVCGGLPSVCPAADPRVPPTLATTLATAGARWLAERRRPLPAGLTLHYVGHRAGLRPDMCPCHPGAPTLADIDRPRWVERIASSPPHVPDTSNSSPPAAVSEFAILEDYARTQLKGQERAVVEHLCAADGGLRIADLGVKPGVGWDDPQNGFKGVQRRLNEKLRPLGWRLSRRDNTARLQKVAARKRG